VPDCSAVQMNSTLPANKAILDATMYNFQDCGETKKETLSDDDIQAMCSIYPAGAPHSCQAVGATSSGGCCSASGNDRPELSLLLAGTTVLALRRRRKKSLDT
jgi:hypothetical protein